MSWILLKPLRLLMPTVQLLGGHKVPLVNNMSHIINHLSFGPAFPGLVNPLDRFERILSDELLTFKYYLKVRELALQREGVPF